MTTIIIDNYDSFTFNIAQMIGEVSGQDPIVLQNNIPWREIQKIPHSRLIISPGPGNPYTKHDVGVSMDVIEYAQCPVLGVCLGHQCLAAFYGGSVVRAPEPLHGRIRQLKHFGDALFDGLPHTFNVTRYHSLIVDTPVPASLMTIAESSDGYVMGLRHRQRPQWGVQFHPESICSEYGRELFANFLGEKITEAYQTMPVTFLEEREVCDTAKQTCD